MEVSKEKFIEGRIVNLQTEDINNLERMYKSVSQKEEISRDELDSLLSKLMSE